MKLAPYKEPPRCPVHRTIMCEQFDYLVVNDRMTLATPNGTYVCYACTPVTPLTKVKGT